MSCSYNLNIYKRLRKKSKHTELVYLPMCQLLIYRAGSSIQGNFQVSGRVQEQEDVGRNDIDI